jgi:glutamine amidotransferase
MNCVIVDYGMGNLRSIKHKLEKIDIKTAICSKPEDIEKADILILPGVGHFEKCMANLRSYDLMSVLNQKVLEEGTPIMGICLGMQLFSKWSEEGEVAGLGWLDAVTKRFAFGDKGVKYKIPHVGWNTINAAKESPLLKGIVPDQLFYFTHSYHICCNNPDDVLTTTHYGYNFVSSVQRGNIFGTQFHPEKSHREGLGLIRNFIDTFCPKTV